MCLKLKSLTPRYAVEDKVVYKWLVSYNDGLIISPFRNFIYELDKSYESLLLREVVESAIGTHYYKNSSSIISIPFFESLVFYVHHLQPGIAVTTCEVNLGFHTYNSKDAALEHYCYYDSVFDASLYKCIIPKGSWYYIGENNEIASDHLIVKGKGID